MRRIPLDETLIFAVSKMIDDSQTDTRKPSHSEIKDLFSKTGLTDGDPNKNGTLPVGKTKRVRAALDWAIEYNPSGGERFIASLFSLVKSSGGFRQESQNYIGDESFKNLKAPLKSLGVTLDEDGTLAPIALESFSGKEYVEHLKQYISRAKKGVEDAALLVGTSKDLMEAVAAHVVTEKWGLYPSHANFPTLLGQAFTALNMATGTKNQEKASYSSKLETNMYNVACAVNNLRNKQGTGHGRPWLPDVQNYESKAAIEIIGVVSELMMSKLESNNS